MAKNIAHMTHTHTHTDTHHYILASIKVFVQFSPTLNEFMSLALHFKPTIGNAPAVTLAIVVTQVEAPSFPPLQAISTPVLHLYVFLFPAQPQADKFCVLCLTLN